MSFENKNYAFAGAFIDELARCGLRHVCICPGSRSSPLAISFARNSHVRKWVHLDERSASFFALGIARYLREPVAVVCSSGTATANFLPAIVEARYSLAPLVVLTADRPPELQDWGALQTIDQTRMYGSHVKWSVNMPPPETSTSMMAFVRSMAGRAMATAREIAAGPVHLNFPFREPLEPATVAFDLPDKAAELQHHGYCGRPGGSPFLDVTSAATTPDHKAMQRLASELRPIERGVIVCGPETGEDLPRCVGDLARRLGYPILADCLSQVRCGPHDRSMVIDRYDLFIRDGEVARTLAPQVVIRFGALPVSKPLVQYLERHQAARHILVDEGTVWRDPLHVTGELWRTDPAHLCTALAGALGKERASGGWHNLWKEFDKAAGQAISAEMEHDADLFEGRVFSELSRLLPPDALLFAGNSMPVRDMDSFFPSIGEAIRFMANRGASGIDGVVSTALGAGAVSSGRLVLVLGDISFYHDMNGLLAAKAFGLNATIVVVNNNGGGIFSFLPQAAYEDVFEPYFGTPHGLTFRAAAEMYGLSYCLAGDWEAFKAGVEKSLRNTGTAIIEVPGDRKLNLKLHRKVQKAVSDSIRQVRTLDGSALS
ncbi:MAG: 2-succinyl-5-enolpyruvyl-6-hydroxy-3-cyclohexene-1-carboxylic-acid synthase [Dehalococcoidia bacterium]|nr:2-succinyl-5-enolpyruvyl-6-hydroxy-3-cyclohexene-1-carboxylic-acid synthase [Dehalococcoidia bacterium]